MINDYATHNAIKGGYILHTDCLASTFQVEWINFFKCKF